MGGLATEQIVQVLPVDAMLIVLGVLHITCALSITLIGHGPPRETVANVKLESGFHVIVSSRYLILMALLMVLVSIFAALVDFAFKSEAARHYTDENMLVSFFARFYAVAGVLTFLVQSTLGSRMLARFGLGARPAALPVVVIFTGFLHIFVTKIWSAVLVRGTQMIIANSFFRAAFEILYTPLSPARKRPTKTIIDVASDKLGDVIGGAILLTLFALVPQMKTNGVVMTAIIVAILSLLVVLQLYRGYIEQLAINLRQGAIELDQSMIVDSTTRQILDRESTPGERALLLAKILDLKYQRVGRMDSSKKAMRAEDTFDNEQETKHFEVAVSALTSGNPRRIIKFLEGDFMDVRLAPFLISLLALDELAEDVRMELRWLVPRSTGMLADALLDPDIPLKARQRIPSVLEVSHNPRAVLALEIGLDDEEFNVRYGCAKALSRMKARSTDLNFDTSTICSAVTKEIRYDEEFLHTSDMVADIDLPIDRTNTQAPTHKH